MMNSKYDESKVEREDKEIKDDISEIITYLKQSYTWKFMMLWSTFNRWCNYKYKNLKKEEQKKCKNELEKLIAVVKADWKLKDNFRVIVEGGEDKILLTIGEFVVQAGSRGIQVKDVAWIKVTEENIIKEDEETEDEATEDEAKDERKSYYKEKELEGNMNKLFNRSEYCYYVEKGKENDLLINILHVLYGIRCKIVHGEIGIGNKEEMKYVRYSYDVLYFLMEQIT